MNLIMHLLYSADDISLIRSSTSNNLSVAERVNPSHILSFINELIIFPTFRNDSAEKFYLF